MRGPALGAEFVLLRALAPVRVMGFWVEDKVVTVGIIRKRYRREATECGGNRLSFAQIKRPKLSLGHQRHNTHSYQRNNHNIFLKYLQKYGVYSAETAI